MIDSAPNEDPIFQTNYRPELPDWGVYLTWPTEGHSLFHPSDLSLAMNLIPSPRVFQRKRWDRTFYQLQYGALTIRVRPTLWVRVDPVDLDVGQQVELLSKQGSNDPGIYRISDILYCSRKQAVEFSLSQRGMTLPKKYPREDLRPLRVVHNLRAGFYQHLPQTSKFPADLELLNVGELTE